MEILNFSYKTNNESAQIKDKIHKHKKNQVLMKHSNNYLYLGNPCLFFGKGKDLVLNKREIKEKGLYKIRKKGHFCHLTPRSVDLVEGIHGITGGTDTSPLLIVPR